MLAAALLYCVEISTVYFNVYIDVVYPLGVWVSLTGLEQQFLQELLALRVPQQYCGWPELSGGPFLRPLPVPRHTQTQQKAAAQLPVPPLLQQRTLHQRLPSGEPVSDAAHQSGADPHR